MVPQHLPVHLAALPAARERLDGDDRASGERKARHLAVTPPRRLDHHGAARPSQRRCQAGKRKLSFVKRKTLNPSLGRQPSI